MNPTETKEPRSSPEERAGLLRPHAEPLNAFIERLSGPRYKAPVHLAPLVDRLSEYQTRPFRLVSSTPPRHGKTETLLHFLAWVLSVNPFVRAAYITYAAQVAENKSRKARHLTELAGVDLAKGANRAGEWQTSAGGGLFAAGVMGPLTSLGFDLILVDDPVKNRAEAESPVYQNRIWDWFNDVAFTRLEPPISAVLVNMARWHRNDLAGRLLDQGDWEHLNLPALTEDGAALWPERYPVEKLLAIRDQVGPLTWQSLFQGSPKPRGGAIYDDFSREDGGNVRPCPFDPALPLMIGMDFNVDPMTAVLYQRHGQEWWVVQNGAIELPNSHTQRMAEKILDLGRQLYGNMGWLRRSAIVCDPSGAARQHNYGTSDVQILRSVGFEVNFRQVRFESDKFNALRAVIKSASGERRFFVDPSNKRLIDRIEQLRPDDPDDHLTDAAAYPVYWARVAFEGADSWA